MKYKTNHTMLSCFRKVSFQVFWNCMIPPTKHLEFGLVGQYKEPQQSSDLGWRNAKKMWKTLSVGNNRDLHYKDESESYGFTIIKEIPASECQGLVAITEISFLLIAGNFTANVDLIDHFCFVFFYTSNGPCTEKTKNNNSYNNLALSCSHVDDFYYTTCMYFYILWNNGSTWNKAGNQKN